MKFRITLSFTVSADSLEEANSVAENGAQHLIDTFNEDGSIEGERIDYEAKPVRTTTSAKKRQKDDATTYAVRINGETLYLDVTSHAEGFRWVDGGEQCHDCGGDDYTLTRDPNGRPKALHCDRCGTDHALRPA